MKSNPKSPISKLFPTPEARARALSLLKRRVKNSPTCLVTPDQARFMLGRSRPCSQCAFRGNQRCSECRGKGFVPTPLSRALIQDLIKFLELDSRRFDIRLVRAFLKNYPLLVQEYQMMRQAKPESYRLLLLEALLQLEKQHDQLRPPILQRQNAELMVRITRKLGLN